MAEHSISAEDAEEYTQSLGQIFGGGWRQIAWADKQGIPAALGLATEEWVTQRLGGYVRLAVSERREAVAELSEQGMSSPEIGKVLGVSDQTVLRDRQASTNVEAEPESSQTSMPDADMSSTFVEAEPESDESSGLESWPEQADVPPWPGFQDDGEEAEPEAAPDPKSTRELLGQSDQNDWRTPRKFLEAARAVLGAVDLDPATSVEANETVEAAQFYTEEDDGLTQPWKGRVWLNPPYGGQARLFVERLVREYEVGNVTAAITLVNSHPTETAWFQQLFRYTICFVRGRIDFGGPSREVSSTSTHGSALAYFGPDHEAFAARFAEFGSVVRRVQ